MADPVLRPVSTGLGPNLRQLQRTGDGQTSPGAGTAAAQAMQGGGFSVDASTVGGYATDTPEKYAKFPAPLAGLLRRNLEGDPDPQGGRD